MAPRMGRRPLKLEDVTVKTTLRFPRSLLERIEAVAGENQVARFIRQAVEAALDAHTTPTKPMAEHPPTSAGRSRAKPRSGPQDP